MTIARNARHFGGQPTEADEMRILADYLDLLGVLWCHVPNGGYRRGREAAMFKRIGVKPGVPDVMIFSAPPTDPLARGVAIELKSRHQHSRPSPHQEWWLEQLAKRGWFTAVAHGADEAIEILRGLGFTRAA